MTNWSSLHNHTDASNISCRFPDSSNKIEDLIEYSYEMGIRALAVTDHECLINHVKMKQIESNYPDMKLIMGNEIYVARSDLTSKTYEKGELFNHMILLAKDKIGYHQMLKLSSKAWSRSFMRAIIRRYNIIEDFEEIIRTNPGHLVGTSACIGGILGNIFKSGTEEKIYPKAKEVVDYMTDLFQGEYYLELAPSLSQDQIRYNKFLLKYFPDAKFTIATDAHYLKKEDFNIFKQFLNSKDTKEREVESFYSYAYVMSWDEIKKLTKDYISEDKLEEIRLNTIKISDSCTSYEISRTPIIPKIPQNPIEVLGALPPEWHYEYIEKFFNSEFLADRHLLWLTYNGFIEKIKKEDIKESLERINKEFKTLWLISEKLNQRLSDYLVTMQKVVNIIWEVADTVVGVSRGSAGAFLTNYLIGITQWNPLKYPLPIHEWRFLTPDRIDLPDIDIDTPGIKRQDVLAAVAEYFKSFGGSVYQISTYKTEGSRSALQTAARGLELDKTIGEYAASLVPSDRGINRSLTECYYGSEENDPITPFIELMDEYPKLWSLARKIEGLTVGLGIHAAGVLLCNEDITDNNALMRAPNGALITAFDLHDSEYLGFVKYDFLNVDGLGKITDCLYYMLQYNKIEWKGSLRKTYDYYLAPDNLKYTDELWENVASNKINSLWQLNTPVGTQALSSIHATSLKEIGIINSVMRLQPQNKNDEQPINIFTKYRNDISLWYNEMKEKNLTDEEIKVLEKHLLPLNGVADTQESIMQLSMDEKISNFTVAEANKLRKAVAKKSKKAQEEIKELFYEKGLNNGTSKELLDYVWNVQISRQLGYSFSLPHVAAYSMIAMQEANLYTYFPHIYWQTACLASEVGAEVEEDFEDLIEKGYIKLPMEKRLKLKVDMENYLNEFEEDDYTEEEKEEIKKAILEGIEDKEGITINRGKVAAAIGRFKQSFNIARPDINTSGYGFKPDEENNTIICGLKIVGKIGTKLIKEIIKGRPYSSLTDFTNRVNISKDRVINLIKAGAFDYVEEKDRMSVLRDYVLSVSDQKKRLTLQNAQMLFGYNMIPLREEKAIFKWKKDISKSKYLSKYYLLSEKALNFYRKQNLDETLLDYVVINGEEKAIAPISYIDNFYKKSMNKVKDFINENKDHLLLELNNLLFMESWNKYKCDNISQGEMQSMRTYIHEHELEKAHFQTLEIDNLQDVEEEKVVKMMNIKGRIIPKYYIYTIMGTVINKDKIKGLITLLTPDGVIDLKIWKENFAKYDKTIANIDNGVKEIIQKSFFEIGTHLVVSGFKRGTTFVPKVYADSQLKDPLVKITLEDDKVISELKIDE